MKENQIRTISYPKYMSETEPILEKLLDTKRDFLSLFNDCLPFRFIGVLNGHFPSREFMEILQSICSGHNGKGFYYFNEFYIKDFKVCLDHGLYSGWYVPFTAIGNSHNDIWSINNFLLLCSNGNWILFGMHEGFYLFGAKKEVGEQINQKNSQIILDSIESFIDDYRSYKKHGIYNWDQWLPQLLNHIYGTSEKINVRKYIEKL